jgi:tetratricopeptide (TPR) repeat protein
LRARYERWGDGTDIDRAAACHEEAMAAAEPGDERWPRHVENLANVLWNRYLQFRSWADLERATMLHRLAVEAFSEPSAERSDCLNNLSLVLHARYEHTGELGELEDAVAAAQEAVETGPAQFDRYPTYLGTLMMMVHTLYEHTTDPDDLRLVIDIGRQLAAMTTGKLARATNLHTLGIALLDQYDASEEPGDLVEAIATQEEALSITAEDTPIYRAYLDDWATTMLRRYKLWHDTEDLDRALTAREQLTRLIPAGAPELAKYLNNLGITLLVDLDLAVDTDAPTRVTDVFRRACVDGLETNPGEALKAAMTWGDWASGRAVWPEAATAYEFGIAATEKLFRTQPLRRHKEAWLETSWHLAGNAAYALLQAGRSERATVTLERGRGLLLSEALERNKVDLRQLEELGRGDLAGRFAQAATRINRLQTLETGTRDWARP